jgi:conserved oligomeric Golgi complex subunit 8
MVISLSSQIRLTPDISSQVVFPYCAACFGRCYPNGAALITECRSTFDSVSQLLTVPARSNSSGISIEREQLGGIERKKSGSIERRQSGGLERSVGSAVIVNGLPPDGLGPEVNNDAGTPDNSLQADVQTSPPSNK